MEINPIKKEQDYQLALERVNILFDAKPDTIEEDELDIIVTLIEKYESIYYPIPKPNGMTDADLGVILKSRSRVSEIFKRKRALSISQIRLLADQLHISANILIKEYSLE